MTDELIDELNALADALESEALMNFKAAPTQAMIDGYRKAAKALQDQQPKGEGLEAHKWASQLINEVYDANPDVGELLSLQVEVGFVGSPHYSVASTSRCAQTPTPQEDKT